MVNVSYCCSWGIGGRRLRVVNNMIELERFIIDNEDIADVYMTDAGYCSNPERKAMYIKAAEKHRQIAELLKELQERREAPEIVRCGECKHLRRWISVNHQFCDITANKVSKNDFCSFAERSTNANN